MRAIPVLSIACIALGSAAAIGLYFAQLECAFLPGGLAVGGLSILLWDQLQQQIHALARPTADAYQEGYEAGYDKGWREGHEPPGLTVVEFRRKR